MNAALVADGYRRARALTRAHAKSFYFSSFALGGARRAAAMALYAFCRRLDDLVDEAPPGERPAATAARLSQARRVVDRIHDGVQHHGLALAGPWHPAELAALTDTVRRFRVPPEPFHDLISGVEMDLTPRCYRTFAELDVYCYRVAGTVGCMLAPVLGARGPEALTPAADLGRAMQQTNILRDVGEDLARGRVYLPLDELAAAGLSEADLARGRVDDRFRGFMRRQIARARATYARAMAGVPALPAARSRLAVRLMAAVYGDILSAIEAEDFDVFRRRALVSGPRKLALAAATLRRAR